MTENMEETKTMTNEEVANAFINNNPTVMWITNAKHFFEYNFTLNTWVMLKEDSIKEAIQKITEDEWKNALASGDHATVKLALRFSEKNTQNKIFKLIKDATTKTLAAFDEVPVNTTVENFKSEEVTEAPMEESPQEEEVNENNEVNHNDESTPVDYNNGSDYHTESFRPNFNNWNA